MAKRKLKKKVKGFIILLFAILIITILSYYVEYKYLSSRNIKGVEQQKEYYTSSDFGLIDIKSNEDHNNNGIDDYIDMVNGAIKKAQNVTINELNYYDNGYPPDNEGITLDIIWSSLKEANFNLKDLIGKDIRNTYKEKIYNIEDIDDNIDFRRINNVIIFLNRYAKQLTTDINKIEEFNQGDIIIFDNDEAGIISNKRNKNGVPYIIKITGKEEYELDILEKEEITNHYRFEYTEELQKLIYNY